MVNGKEWGAKPRPLWDGKIDVLLPGPLNNLVETFSVGGSSKRLFKCRLPLRGPGHGTWDALATPYHHPDSFQKLDGGAKSRGADSLWGRVWVLVVAMGSPGD